MTDQQPTSRRMPELGWPIVVLCLALLGALVVVMVTGKSVDDFARGVAAIFAPAGALAGIGAWLQSTRAARQTNGDLDRRMHNAVKEGVTSAIATAQTQQAATVRPTRAAAHARKPTDPPTERMAVPPGDKPR